MIALKQLLEESQISIDTTTNSNINNDSEIFIDPLLSSSVALPNRALIFCQWRSSIDLIAEYIDKGIFGAEIKYTRLDGTIPPNERQKVVDQFNRDSSIHLMLLSTHIGGVGLTLTGANIVIFVDHDWNPVKDLQAIDRAHRIGQTRTVNVYRLITKDSIEEKVLVGANNSSLTAMSSGELKDLLSLGEGPNTKSTSKKNGFSSKPTNAKKPKLESNGNGLTDVIEATYSLKDLWDESQYDEQHNVQTFIENAK